jgi:hypothetical protein
VSSENDILVAGIGNIFLGDDGFGVEVARELTKRGGVCGARVVDFGLRGLDLAYALMEPWRAARAQPLRVSTLNGDGLNDWCGWLAARGEAARIVSGAEVP